MNVCKKETPTPQPEPRPGRLYQLSEDEVLGGTLYLCDANNTLINVQTGRSWNKGKGFSGQSMLFKDVTDKYCLKEL